MKMTPANRATTTSRARAGDFFETGTEGTIWSVLDDDERGYEALHTIDDGDHLTIHN